MKADLRTWRNRRQLSQQGLASACGLSTRTIWKYERDGFHKATMETVLKIVDVLEIELSQLLLEGESDDK